MKVESEVIAALDEEVKLFSEVSAIEAEWMDNFHNCNMEILNVIAKSDREIQSGLVAQIYGDDFSMDDWSSLKTIKPSKVQWFGRMVNFIRFGAGYIGNGEQGDQLLDVECLAMNFSYRAYWTCGSNYMIRAVLGEYLDRHSRMAPWPLLGTNGGKRDQLVQTLASNINLEIQKLREFYEIDSFHRGGFVDELPVKPELRDFRAMLRQINE